MRLFGLLALASVLVGCAPSVAKQPVGAPPTPVTVTRDEPGGDAADPHVAALERLASAGWGWRNDRRDALHVPMPDWQNWRRVTFWGMPTFAGYRYGDDHHAVIGVWVRDAQPGAKADPETCLDGFAAWGEPKARDFGVRMAEVGRVSQPFQRSRVAVRSVDAHVAALFNSGDYAAAYAGYAIWPGACTIVGVAVPARGAFDAAKRVRDRWVREGFGRLDPRTMTLPPP